MCQKESKRSTVCNNSRRTNLFHFRGFLYYQEQPFLYALAILFVVVKSGCVNFSELSPQRENKVS